MSKLDKRNILRADGTNHKSVNTAKMRKKIKIAEIAKWGDRDVAYRTVYRTDERRRSISIQVSR